MSNFDPHRRYPGHTKEWYACYSAVLREFPVHEFGEEAYEIAARAASTIVYHPIQATPTAATANEAEKEGVK